jgi:hypothetical protein
MNFCPDCGVKRIQEAKYCHNCGYSFLKMTNPETKKVFTTEEVLNDPRFKEMASKFNTWEGLDAAKSFLSLPYTLFNLRYLQMINTTSIHWKLLKENGLLNISMNCSTQSEALITKIYPLSKRKYLS